MKFGTLQTDAIEHAVQVAEAEEREAAVRLQASREKWDHRFLKLAVEVSTWSKDPSTKVGVVIVNYRRIVSTGYNGFPSGMSDADELYFDRAEKYERVMHAEANAIIQAQQSVNGMIMYCSALPCHKCALAIIQAGIVRVVSYQPQADLLSRWRDSFNRMYDYFKESGVSVVEYPDPNVVDPSEIPF